MISKELLSKVLNLVEVKGIYEESDYTYDLCDRELNYAERLIVFDTVGYNKYMIINIHELAHKCKEWALSEGYIIKSFLYDDNQDREYTAAIARVRYTDYNSNYIEVFACDAETEPEATFKACEWILKEMR